MSNRADEVAEHELLQVLLATCWGVGDAEADDLLRLVFAHVGLL